MSAASTWTAEDLAAVEGVFGGLISDAASEASDPLCDPSTSRSEEPHAPKDWRQLRAIVLHRDGYSCQACGADATVADHIWPKSRGGADKLSNLQALCAPCNGSKGDSLRLVHVTHDRLEDARRAEIAIALRAVQLAARWQAMAEAVAGRGQLSMADMARVDEACKALTENEIKRILVGVAAGLGVEL